MVSEVGSSPKPQIRVNTEYSVSSREMGLLDTEHRETKIDRHDHNTVYEGNVGARRAIANNTLTIAIAILVIIVLVVLVFTIKYVVNKCVEKVIKAVQREVTPHASN